MFIPLHGLVVVLTGLVMLVRMKGLGKITGRGKKVQCEERLGQDVFARVGRVFPAPRIPVSD